MPLIRFIFCSALACIAGCTSWMPGPTTAPLSRAQLPLKSDRLMLQGRFAASYEEVNHRIGHAYGHFSWIEKEDAVTLELGTPLGQTLAIITAPRSFFLPPETSKEAVSDATTLVRIQRPNRPIQTATDVESLMQNALGFSFPVRTLRHALLKMHSTSAWHFPEQNGWVVERIPPTRAAAPQRLMLEHRASPALRIKLTIDP